MMKSAHVHSYHLWIRFLQRKHIVLDCRHEGTDQSEEQLVNSSFGNTVEALWADTLVSRGQLYLRPPWKKPCLNSSSCLHLHIPVSGQLWTLLLPEGARLRELRQYWKTVLNFLNNNFLKFSRKSQQHQNSYCMMHAWLCVEFYCYLFQNKKRNFFPVHDMLLILLIRALSTVQ